MKNTINLKSFRIGRGSVKSIPYFLMLCRILSSAMIRSLSSSVIMEVHHPFRKRLALRLPCSAFVFKYYPSIFLLVSIPYMTKVRLLYLNALILGIAPLELILTNYAYTPMMESSSTHNHFTNVTLNNKLTLAQLYER